MSIETYSWPNGFRVIYQKSQNVVNNTHIQVFCDVGSAHEVDNIRGASHLIEHMCFKGTQKIPTTKELMVYYDKIGAYFNAYTEKRYTCYVLKCADEYIEHSLVIMSDMILNSKFNKKEFLKEQHVVIEENIRSSDDPINSIQDLINMCLYNGSSFMYPIDTLGYHKTGLNYEDILDFYHTFYRPSRMIVSIVSNQPFSFIKRALKKTYFIKQHVSEVNPSQFFINYRIHPQQDVKIILKRNPNINTTHLCIGFRTETKDKYVLNMLNNIISGTFNSRLFILLREQKGLTYTSLISTNYNEFSGDFTIYTEADNTKIMRNGLREPGVFPIIIKMLLDLIKNGVSSEEMRLAHGFEQGHIQLKMENNNNIVNHNGYHFLIHPDVPIVPFSEIYKVRYQRIRKSDVNAVIQTYFKRSGMAIGMIGDKLPSEKQITKLLEKIPL